MTWLPEDRDAAEAKEMARPYLEAKWPAHIPAIAVTPHKEDRAMMVSMSYDDDPFGNWQETQPPRTDTVLPRKEPPVVVGDTSAVWLVILTFDTAALLGLLIAGKLVLG
jgi:hypothetical protein